MPVGEPPRSVTQASATAKFQRIRSTRAFDEIAGQIREELAEGRLRVGERLPSERAMSEQFGVSRNTLREALRSLEHAGLIELQKGAHGGAFITERSGEAVTTGLMDMYHLGSVQPEQLTEARIWLESVVVRQACKRATKADIEALNRNIEETRAAAASGNFALRAEKNVEFHRILATMTRNPIMVIVMNGVLDVLRHFISKIGDYDNAFVLPSRVRFMKHLTEGDADAAVAEMELCLKRLQRNYLSRIEQQPKARKRTAR
jgi:GntR family transcriptional repressor for pyruvate dehydrogenase complex